LKTHLSQEVEDQGRSIKWLSKRTDIEYQRLHRIVTGINAPKPFEMEQLARALDVSITELFFSEANA